MWKKSPPKNVGNTNRNSKTERSLQRPAFPQKCKTFVANTFSRSKCVNTDNLSNSTKKKQILRKIQKITFSKNYLTKSKVCMVCISSKNLRLNKKAHKKCSKYEYKISKVSETCNALYFHKTSRHGWSNTFTGYIW